MIKKISEENPEFSRLMKLMVVIKKDTYFEFVEGAMTAYEIIRGQLESDSLEDKTE